MGRSVLVNAPEDHQWASAWSQLSTKRTTRDKISARWDGLRVITDSQEMKPDPRRFEDVILNFDDPTPVIDPLPRPYGTDLEIHPFHYREDEQHYTIGIFANEAGYEILDPENVIALYAADIDGTINMVDSNIHDDETPEIGLTVPLAVPGFTGGSYLYLATVAPVAITHIEMGLGFETLGAWQQVNSGAAKTNIADNMLSLLGLHDKNTEINVLRTNHELADVFAYRNIEVGAQTV